MRRKLLALGVVLAAILFGAAPAAAHPGQASVRFDPDEVGWYSYHGKTMTEFDTILTDWGRHGMIPIDIEVDGFGSRLTFGGAAQTNTDGRAWLVDTVMTPAEYETTNATALKQNMRLADREMYYSGTSFMVGALWVANTEALGWVTSTYTMTLSELTTFVSQQDHAGRLPIDFDMYRDSGGKVRYSAVFLDNPEGLDWHLRGDLSYAGFQSLDATYGGSGFRTISIDSANSGSGQLFGAIWWENANARTWASRVHSSETDYTNWWGYLADQGLRQIFNGRYLDSDGKVRLLSTWRQNNNRVNWDLRQVVDGIVSAEMAVDDVPGVSVAVMENGVFRYQRGFGYADIKAGLTMNSAHVLRTASISKAIGGTLLLKVAEEGTGGLTVTDSARTWESSLPSFYQPVRLMDLASNRGCVRWYASKETYSDPKVAAAQADADAEMRVNAYDSSAEALPLYANDPLVCTPGTYRYSTQGYGVLGAALEGATGMTSADLLRQEISGPLGLASLAIEDLKDTSVNRAQAYGGAGNDLVDLAKEQKSWSPFGGGVWSTAGDLCGYAHALVTGQIIADPDDIWTSTPWTNYAYGWYLGTQNGHVKITKDGKAGGADSYLIAYPDDDITIAVLINREEISDDSSARAIAEAIGSMLV